MPVPSPPSPPSPTDPPTRGRFLLANFLAGSLALGAIGSLATLYGMTIGAPVAPLAIISGLFVVIGLQYVVWRVLGLIGPTPNEPLDRNSTPGRRQDAE